jgi:hypothetical protein
MPEHTTIGPASNETVLPHRHPDVEVAEFGAEYVVLAADAKQMHRLQGFSAVVFDVCDGSTTVGALVAEVVDAGLGDAESGIAEVRRVLEELADLGLLEGTSPAKAPPCLDCGQPAKRRRWRR